MVKGGDSRQPTPLEATGDHASEQTAMGGGDAFSVMLSKRI